MSNDLPYRPCVGVALVNRAGDAFIGLRKRKRSSEVLDARSWQMPQGGIDDGEEPLEAAKRELWEETNVRSIELIAELPRWLKYDLPEGARGRWSGRYRGQTQKWFLFRFVGLDKEIDVRRPAGGAARRRVRRLALGALRASAGPCRAVQAGGLRDCRGRVCAARATWRSVRGALIRRPSAATFSHEREKGRAPSPVHGRGSG